MNFEEARPEYYEGLKVFQKNTDQQEQLQKLVEKFFTHLKANIEQTTPALAGDDKTHAQLQALVTQSLTWMDVGSGDGTFTQKMLESVRQASLPAPVYTGIEPDEYFCEMSRQLLTNLPHIDIRQGTALEGNLHTYGQSQIVSGMNVLYFANNLTQLKDDLEKTVEPCGLGLFIQNSLFTDKAGEAFIGDAYMDYTASIKTEVFFPAIPQQGFNLITGKASIADIQKDGTLSDDEKCNTILTKKIIDSMGGISTETDAGQDVAKKYESRIGGDDFGGKGRYVTDNLLLVYTHPDAPEALTTILKNTLSSVRRELAAEAAKPSLPSTSPPLRSLSRPTL